MARKTASGVFKVRKLAKQDRKNHLAEGMNGESTIQVKGGLVADLVNIIRENPDKNWDQYLLAQDHELINGCILSSEWYPLSPFRRMGEAIFKEVAGSDKDKVRAFGKAGIKRFLSIYQNIIVLDDPVQSLKNLIEFREMFVQGEFKIKVSNGSPSRVQNYIGRPPEILEVHLFEAFCYLLAGAEEAIVSLAGGRSVTSLIESKPEGCEITLSWEPVIEGRSQLLLAETGNTGLPPLRKQRMNPQREA